MEDLIDIITGANTIFIPDDYNEDESNREQFSLFIDNEEQNFTSPLYEYYFSEEKLHKKPLIYANHLANIQKIIESLR